MTLRDPSIIGTPAVLESTSTNTIAKVTVAGATVPVTMSTLYALSDVNACSVLRVPLVQAPAAELLASVPMAGLMHVTAPVAEQDASVAMMGPTQ